ncbi:50S ribosomal protein L11 methyltransferase [bacterium]|nr:50S ribosomal protein L11 methyltransferase [candidate division CSSED10-310 bacterium]
MNQQKRWWQLTLICSETLQELFENICWENGTLGIQNFPDSAHNHFISYWQNPDTLHFCINRCNDLASRLATHIQWTTSEIDDQEWGEKWHAFFKPILVGRKFLVYPPWDIPVDDYRFKIVINPGQAFGTGYHETTSMMIEILETIDLKNKRILDAGCGSGILSICADRLGAASIFACDIDPTAIAETRDNAGRNDIFSLHCLIGTPEAYRPGTFDLIVANLDLPAFANHKKTLFSLLKASGILVLSGILNTQEKTLKEYFKEHEFEKQDYRYSGEWSAMVLQKR